MEYPRRIESDLPRLERETTDPIVALKLGHVITEIQESVPRFDFDDADTINTTSIGLTPEISGKLDTFEQTINQEGLAKFGLLEAINSIRTMLRANEAHHLHPGKHHRRSHEGQALKTFETAFATHILFDSPEEMIRYNPRIPRTIAHRISGFNISDTPERKYLGAREKPGSSFNRIIRHEERHVWDNLFEKAWREKPTTKADDLIGDNEKLSQGRGFSEFYNPEVQQYVRKELTAFFCEGATQEEMLTRFLGPLDEDNYNFSDPRLYQILGFYYPHVASFLNQEPPAEFTNHYQGVMTQAIETYFHSLETASEQNLDANELTLRNTVANTLIFARLKDMPVFQEAMSPTE